MTHPATTGLEHHRYNVEISTISKAAQCRGDGRDGLPDGTGIMIGFGFGRKKKAAAATQTDTAAQLRQRLGSSSIVLVGLMGCGKSAIGRRLAAGLGLPFVDADEEIERAAGKSISEIFADDGEPFFRERERMVIARLLSEGPRVVATGGGAFMNEDTRANIRASGISVWLRAELPVLMRRVGKRDTRPLLKQGDPETVMKKLMETRYPVYEKADITVESREVAHEVIVGEIVEALQASAKLAPAKPV
jgi:shikimate kinase